MKYILYILLITQALFSNELKQETAQKLESKESSVFIKTNSSTAKFVNIDNKYFEKVIFNNESTSKSLYVSYKNQIKTIYKNQRFAINIKALITNNNFDVIKTRFLDSYNMKVLNPDSKWEKLDENTYENKFYFKALEHNFKVPSFQVLLYDKNTAIEASILRPLELEFREIAKNDKKFSKVIANNLKINTYKTKQYNNEELITIIDLEANDSNLEDFNIKDIVEQGISSLNKSYELQKMLYYLVIPVHKKVIEFSYYDLNKKQLVSLKVPIILENGLVSTQTDLNPNKSNFVFYKKVAVGTLALIFMLLFLWKRKYFLLVIAAILFLIFALFIIPNKVSYLKKETVVYILPTNNSTIFFKVKNKEKVEIVSKKDNFVKIMFDFENKNIIGWVKNENLSKN